MYVRGFIPTGPPILFNVVRDGPHADPQAGDTWGTQTAQFRKLALLEAGRCSTRWARGGACTDIARGVLPVIYRIRGLDRLVPVYEGHSLCQHFLRGCEARSTQTK